MTKVGRREVFLLCLGKGNRRFKLFGRSDLGEEF